QLSAQLSGGSEDYRASAHRNTTIANESGLGVERTAGTRNPGSAPGPEGTPHAAQNARLGTGRSKTPKTRGQTHLSTRRKMRALGQAGRNPGKPGDRPICPRGAKCAPWDRRVENPENPGTDPSVHAAQNARLGTGGAVPSSPPQPRDIFVPSCMQER